MASVISHDLWYIWKCTFLNAIGHSYELNTAKYKIKIHWQTQKSATLEPRIMVGLIRFWFVTWKDFPNQDLVGYWKYLTRVQQPISINLILCETDKQSENIVLKDRFAWLNTSQQPSLNPQHNNVLVTVILIVKCYSYKLKGLLPPNISNTHDKVSSITDDLSV